MGEGNVNEHQSSTGILDCETTYPEEGNGNCVFDAVTGNNKCPTADKNCRTETVVRTKFDAFIAAADTNGDNIITTTELEAVEILYNDDGRMPDSVDFNRGTQTGNTEHDEVEGTVAGSFGLLVTVFGEECDSITKETLETVLILNEYPSHYSFPSSRSCVSTPAPTVSPSPAPRAPRAAHRIRVGSFEEQLALGGICFCRYKTLWHFACLGSVLCWPRLAFVVGICQTRLHEATA